MKVIIKVPDHDPAYIIVPNGYGQLARLQELVGGYIEAYTVSPDLVILMDEDGKLKDKPMNFLIPGDYVAGTALFVGVDGEEFADCPYTDVEIEEIIEGFDV